MTNVLPGAEDGYCGPIAYELHRIADALADAASFELPEPRLFQIGIQPGGQSDDEVVEAVDALGLALLGEKGSLDLTGGAPWYSVQGLRGPVKIQVYRALAKPVDSRDAELAELRAENESLRAQLKPVTIEDHLAAGGTVENTPDGRLVFSGGLVDESVVDEFVVAANRGIVAALDEVVDTEEGLRRVKQADRRTCALPGDQEHDHAMCEDSVAEERPTGYAPQFGDPGYPGCPGCGKSVVAHAPGCAEDES